MKRALLYIASAAILLGGCAKVAEQNTDEIIGKVYRISAVVENNETRTFVTYDSDAKKYYYDWNIGEQIGVIPNGYNVLLPFEFEDANTDTFAYTAPANAPEYTSFGLAVSPKNAIIEGSEVDNFSLVLSGEYVQGESNAVMVAGAPTDVEGEYKFSFKHAGALVRVIYKSIPAETAAMVLSTPDHPIQGDWAFFDNPTTPYEMVAEGASAIDGENNIATVTYDPDASLNDFYVPIPTGQYTTFTVKLVKEGGAVIPGSEKTFATTAFTVARSIVVKLPEIEVEDDDLSGDWIMVGFNGDKAYACPAYSSGTNIKGVEVTVNNGIVSSTETNLKMTFTKVNSGEYEGMYTIQDANGYYLYAASSSGNQLKASETISTTNSQNYYWSISDDGEGEYVIVASESSNRNNLRFNYNGGSTLFACYEQSSTTGTLVHLYKWEDANITLTCEKPVIAFDGTNVTITTETTGATIFYTLDGSTPSNSSTQYTAPFSISETKTVKAIAVADGYQNSEVAEMECVVGDSWTLVKSTDGLVVGDLYVIANNTNLAVAGPLSSDYLSSITSGVVFTSDKNSITTLPDNALQFTLGGQTDAWTLTCSEGALFSQAAKKVNFSSNGTGTWKISFSGDNAIITNGTSSYGSIQYNSGNPRFTTYSSAQSAIQLYHKPGAPDLREDATLTFSASTATATVGVTFTPPVLTKDPADITVTWSSTNQSVAYVNPESGVLEIKKAGETTIKASFAGNTQYKPAEAEYDLTVNPSYDITFTNATDNKVNVGAAQNAEVKFKVNSSYAWNSSVSYASGFDNSFTVNPTQGAAGEVEITVKASVENTSEDARQLGTVTISNGGDSKTVQVWQNGKVSDYSNVNTSNITLTVYGSPANATAAYVKIGSTDYDALKAGTGSNSGVARIRVPAGTKTLHLHIAAWNNESVSVSITGATCEPSSLSLTADSGISGSGSTYTLKGDAPSYYKTVSLTNITDDTILTFTATSGKRFVIWGVNVE